MLLRADYAGNYAKSVCNIDIRDHTQSDQQERAMNVLKWEQAIVSNASTSSYPPLCKFLAQFLK